MFLLWLFILYYWWEIKYQIWHCFYFYFLVISTFSIIHSEMLSLYLLYIVGLPWWMQVWILCFTSAEYVMWCFSLTAYAFLQSWKFLSHYEFKYCPSLCAQFSSFKTFFIYLWHLLTHFFSFPSIYLSLQCSGLHPMLCPSIAFLNKIISSLISRPCTWFFFIVVSSCYCFINVHYHLYILYMLIFFRFLNCLFDPSMNWLVPIHGCGILHPGCHLDGALCWVNIFSHTSEPPSQAGLLLSPPTGNMVLNQFC